jgi:CelD/BcsL family acetyltransferase involved in cellulose biosynthesis
LTPMTSLPHLHTDLIDREAALETEADAWQRLNLTGTEPSPFLSWTWHQAWMRTWGARHKLATIVVRDRGVALAIAPLCLTTRRYGHLFQLNSLVLAGCEHVGGDYLNIIAAAGQEPEAVQALFDALAARFDWDVMELNGVAEDSALRPLYQRAAASRDLPLVEDNWVECPRTLLPESWECYLKTLSANTRKEMRRKERKFTEKYRTRFLIHADPDACRTGFECLVDLNRRRFTAADIKGGFLDPEFTAFHERFLASPSEAQGEYPVRIAILEADGRAVAAQYLLALGDTWYSYQSGMDPDLANDSPGSVLDVYILRHLIENAGVKCFDFLRGNESYKQRFSNDTRRIGRILVFNRTAKGRMAAKFLAVKRRLSAGGQTRMTWSTESGHRVKAAGCPGVADNDNGDANETELRRRLSGGCGGLGERAELPRQPADAEQSATPS